MFKSLYMLLTTNRAIRIGLPLFVAAAIITMGANQISHAKPMYKASARIWVQRSLFGGGRGSQPGEIPDSPLLEGNTNLATFAEVVQSDAVLNLAFDELKTKVPESEVPSRESLSGIRAVPAKDANIITLEFRAAKPETAHIVIKCVINALMKMNSMQIAGPLEETRERLTKQLEIARQEYSAAKSKLKDFQDSVGAVDFESEAAAMSQSRSDLQQQCDDAENELKALRTKIDFLQKQLGFGPDDVLAVEKISNDEVVDHLKQTIAETEVKLIELRSKFQESHPRVKRLRAVLEDAKKEMADRYSVLIGKVDSKFDGISKDNEAQHQLLTDMLEAHTEVVVGESKIKSLQESLAAISQRITMLPKKEQELADLQRQDDLATNTLAAVESELQRVKLTESVSLSSSRLQVIDSGDGVESAGFLSYPIVFFAALVAAALTATVQYFLDPRVLGIAHLRAFGWRTVGWFPRIGDQSITSVIPNADRVRVTIKDWLEESKVVWITSADSGDGKSLIARTLAESFEDAGFNVVLIDADLSRPSLHVALQESASPGLLQHLEGETSLKSTMRQIGDRVKFIPAGGISENVRLLSSTEFSALLDTISAKCDVVIVDGPAAGYDDCALQLPDGPLNLIVSVRVGHTIRASLQTLKHQLQVLPVCETGLVLHAVKGQDMAKLNKDLPSVVAPTQHDAVPVAVSAGASNDSAVATW